MPTDPNPETKAKWIRWYAEYRNSGLSVNRFAAQKGVTASIVYAWFKRLRLPTETVRRNNSNPYPSVKLVCQDCGCMVKIAPKWLNKSGTPSCGCGGEFEVAICNA